MRSCGNPKKIAFWAVAISLSLMLAGWGQPAMGFSKKALLKTNNEGPVEVAVTYLNPLSKEPSRELSFEVRMSTHSVNLDDYEMEKISFLQIDRGPKRKALGWFDQSGGGHHVSGILKFTGPIPSSAKSLQLIIREVGDVGERAFEWNLPLEQKKGIKCLF